ncbi:hypothetical protein MmazTMA_17430 [Methanosarcina mazei]|nr:hypothetical protein MmazTMA_17430 [Methanosarcina mazei]
MPSKLQLLFRHYIGFGIGSKTYYGRLPNSLLIAQAFIMKYPDYGRGYVFSLINKVIEDGIKEGIFYNNFI